MASNLNIDENLLAEAQRLGAKKTKRETVNEALAEYIQRRKQKQILSVFGKIDMDPEYDYKKKEKDEVKILVDTSVWSLALRRKDESKTKEATQLSEFIQAEQPVFLCGVILMEILQGIRQPEQWRRVRRHLEPFPVLELNRDGYANAAMLGSLCRSKGVQSTTADLIIAQTAIEHKCHLLTTDRDFLHIADHSLLKLV